MVAHSTPKAGVEWGTQSLGCRCREDGSFLSRLASASGLLEMTILFEDRIPRFQEKHDILAATELSSRLPRPAVGPERSVVERSAVSLEVHTLFGH
jgi:hypothetical protein